MKEHGSRILSLIMAILISISGVTVFADADEDLREAAGAENGEIITQDVPTEEATAGSDTEEAADNSESEPGEQIDQPAQPELPALTAPKVSSEVKANELIIRWSAVPEAESYLVKVWAASAKEPNDSAAVAVRSTTYSFALGGDAAYYYKAAAVRGAETAWSDTAKYNAPSFSAPILTTSELRYGSADNGVILKWKMSSTRGVTSYEILRGTSSKVGSMKKIASVKAGTLKYEYLENTAGTYYYAVRAVSSSGTSRYSTASSRITVSNDHILKTKGLVWYGYTKAKVKLVKTARGKAAVTTLKKGTKVTAIGKYPSHVAKFHQPTWVKVKTSNGKIGWLKYSQLSGGVKAAVNIGKDYTRSVKEDYVNSKGYTSKTGYLIWVCTYTQRAYTFKGSKGKWKLVSTDRVTSGRFSHATSAIYEKNRSSKNGQIHKRSSRVFMVTEKGNRYYFKNASYFAPGLAFHTGTWWASGKKRGSVVNKPDTYGCLRMYDSGAAYIYGLPMHTSVIISNNA